MSTPASNNPGLRPERAPELIEDLATSLADGTPAIVLFDDYLEREGLALELMHEAEIHGVNATLLRGPEEVINRLPTLSATKDDAAIVLLDRGAGAQLGPWLEAAREALAQWVRFFILLTLPSDVPALASTAPAFMSWAKGLEFRKLARRHDTPGLEAERELEIMTAETGLSPEQFIAAWHAGQLPDTFRNTTWLSLAWAAVRRGQA